MLMVLSSAVAFAGIVLAVYFWLRNRAAADALAQRMHGLYVLLCNKYYVDEIYDTAVVQPIRLLSTNGLWKGVDVADRRRHGERRRQRGADARAAGSAGSRPDRSGPTPPSLFFGVGVDARLVSVAMKGSTGFRGFHRVPRGSVRGFDGFREFAGSRFGRSV